MLNSVINVEYSAEVLSLYKASNVVFNVIWILTVLVVSAMSWIVKVNTNTFSFIVEKFAIYLIHSHVSFLGSTCILCYFKKEWNLGSQVQGQEMSTCNHLKEVDISQNSRKPESSVQFGSKLILKCYLFYICCHGNQIFTLTIKWHQGRYLLLNLYPRVMFKKICKFSSKINLNNINMVGHGGWTDWQADRHTVRQTGNRKMIHLSPTLLGQHKKVRHKTT